MRWTEFGNTSLHKTNKTKAPEGAFVFIPTQYIHKEKP
jgi:hypothetical protein